MRYRDELRGTLIPENIITKIVLKGINNIDKGGNKIILKGKLMRNYAMR